MQKTQLGDIAVSVAFFSIVMFIICFTDFIINYFTM